MTLTMDSQNKTYSQAELVAFGNYLLSDERFSHIQEESNLNSVNDADIANWEDSLKAGEKTIKIETSTIKHAVNAIEKNARVLGEGIRQSEHPSSLMIIGRIDYGEEIADISGLFGAHTSLAVTLTETMLDNEKIALIIKLAIAAYETFKNESNDNEEED